MFRFGLTDTALEQHQTRALRLIETYWHRSCPQGGLPLRTDIDPRKIEDALEYAFLIERIAPTHARIRVAGGHLGALAGMEVSGMPLSLFVQPRDRDEFGTNLSKLFDAPAKLSFDLCSPGAYGLAEVTARMTLFPLLDDFGRITRAVGGLTSTGRIIRTPRRFNITSLDVRPLDKIPAPFAPPIHEKPNLRLVVDNA